MSNVYQFDFKEITGSLDNTILFLIRELQLRLSVVRFIQAVMESCGDFCKWQE